MARGWVSRAVATGSVAAGAGGAGGAGAAAAGRHRAEGRRCCCCYRGSAAGGWAGSHAHPQVMPSPDAAPAAQPGAPGEGAVSADALLLAGRGRPARYSAGAPLFPLLRPCGCSARGRAVSSLLWSVPPRRELLSRLHARHPARAEGQPRRSLRAPQPGGAARGHPRPGRADFIAGGQVGARRPRQRPPRRGLAAAPRDAPLLSGSRVRPALARPPLPAQRGSPGEPRGGGRDTAGASVRRRAAAVPLSEVAPECGRPPSVAGDVPPVGWADGCRGAPAAGFEP